MLIAQITDCHIVEAGELLNDRVDTATMLSEAVAHINHMAPRPDVVVATGDLVNTGTPAEYAVLAPIVSKLDVPLLVIPGNHDDRTLLRDTFNSQLPAGGPTDRIDYVVDTWPLRLVGLDTTIPGDNSGLFSADQMMWLDEALGAKPDRPTLIFQHHPPFVTGIAWMDAVGLAGRELEAELLARHPQVCGVVCGHIHRNIHTTIAHTAVSTSPSTGAQVALALDGTPYEYVDELGVVTIHQWSAELGLVSHVSHVGLPQRWLPAWAVEELAQSDDL